MTSGWETKLCDYFNILGDEELKDLIGSVSSEFNFDQECKIERSDDVALVTTPDCVYRIRYFSSDSKIAPFDNVLRQAFVEEYKCYGLEFNLQFVNDGNRVYRIEKQQKFKNLESVELSSGDILRMGATVLFNVERRLEFPHLASQILTKGNFEGVNKIGIARDCPFDCADYAICDNKTLCLNDASFFLSLIDDRSNWFVDSKEQFINVELPYGSFCFANYATCMNGLGARISELDKCVSKWWLFPEDSLDVIETRRKLKEELKAMLSKNVELISSGRLMNLKTDED